MLRDIVFPDGDEMEGYVRLIGAVLNVLYDTENATFTSDGSTYVFENDLSLIGELAD